MRTCKELLIVYILFGPRNHLKDVKELFLAELNQLLQLFCSIFLTVCGLVVDRRAGH